MPGRLPVRADFPANLTVSVTPPPQSKPAANVLILLHGLGDTSGPFATLGTRLALSETACVSVQAPNPLPFDLAGFHWGDDITFNQASGQIDVDTGFERAMQIIGHEVVRKVLVEKCGFSLRELIIFGFGQGGMVGLTVARALGDGRDQMGGVVSVGGPLPSGTVQGERDNSEKTKTPIIVLHGFSKSLITTTAAKVIKASFEHVIVHMWRRPGDGMPTNREEMLPIMQFFARRLKSQAGVPEGGQEIT